MNRRGFFGLIGKAIAVGITIGVSPKLFAPVQKVMLKYSWVVGDGVVHQNYKAVWTIESIVIDKSTVMIDSDDFRRQVFERMAATS